MRHHCDRRGRGAGGARRTAPRGDPPARHLRPPGGAAHPGPGRRQADRVPPRTLPRGRARLGRGGCGGGRRGIADVRPDPGADGRPCRGRTARRRLRQPRHRHPHPGRRADAGRGGGRPAVGERRPRARAGTVRRRGGRRPDQRRQDHHDDAGRGLHLRLGHQLRDDPWRQDRCRRAGRDAGQRHR
ncbi:hypothetical protein SDC9_152624 [bioreactor metagenome]|uniref:Uncharacterized protein n=1 Tax=bioreactor metagenome TaxID=1076179 RepID=A0A645EY81_9ZZZZ